MWLKELGISLRNNSPQFLKHYNGVSEVVDLLDQQKVVAIFQGKCEAGPRALGNRSILYDPRDPDALKKINKIKGREWWRPFAGTILQEYAHEWFEMLTLKETPYMMYSIPVKEEKKHLIPGIIHRDGTSRIQTVTQKQNYYYYHLIKRFYERTGIPLLFNTSFNLAGEVICYTVEDALDILKRSDIDYLYLPEKDEVICIS